MMFYLQGLKRVLLRSSKLTRRDWVRLGLIAIIGSVALVFGIMWAMKNSDAFQISMREVRSDERVVNAMGEPIEAGWFIMGHLSLSLGGAQKGSANYSIPVSSPKCEGTVVSRAIRQAGVWEVYYLVVELECLPKSIVLIDDQNTFVPIRSR